MYANLYIPVKVSAYFGVWFRRGNSEIVFTLIFMHSNVETYYAEIYISVSRF